MPPSNRINISPAQAQAGSTPVRPVSLARKLLRSGKKAALCVLQKMADIFIFFSEQARLRYELRSYFNRRMEDYCLRQDFSKTISSILKRKIVHLDVGASAGPIAIVKKYSRFFDMILCEPAPAEAQALRDQGYKVIEKALSDKVGEVTLFETKLSYGSSVYRPRGPYLDFYNPDPQYCALYDTVKETVMESSTISRELDKLGVAAVDFLKLDTQGSELDILKGLGRYRPLVIMTEIEYLPLYHGQPNAYEVCQYLFQMGYIPFSLTSSPTGTLCPVYGDGFFMPSWVEPDGIRLIQTREEQYIALMLMFGQGKVLKFVNGKINLRNKKFIESLHAY